MRHLSVSLLILFTAVILGCGPGKELPTEVRHPEPAKPPSDPNGTPPAASDPAAKAVLDRWPGKVPVPVDAVVAKAFAADAPATLKAIEDLDEDDRILDLGPTSVAVLKTIVAKAGTIVWNGPVGVFEFDAFASGTRELARAIASSSAFSIAGGGDTIAAIHKFGVAERIGYISTAGGAFLEFLEGRTLPAVAALEARAANAPS